MFLNTNAKKLLYLLDTIEDINKVVLFTDPSLVDGVYKKYYLENKKILQEASKYKFKSVCIIGERTNTKKELDLIFKDYEFNKTIVWKNSCEERFIYLYSTKEINIGNQIEEKITNKDFECVTPDNLIIKLYKALNINKEDTIVDFFAGSNNICHVINEKFNNLYISSEINRNIYQKAILKINL